jgi:hypothetical protein
VTALTVNVKDRAVGDWSLQLPAKHEAVSLLTRPGWGVLITRAGRVLTSGPTVKPTRERSTASPVGTATITGLDDNTVLADMLAWPSPGTLDLEAQDGTAGSGYDERTGVAETVMRAYVNANVGPGAVVGRRNPLLDLAPDLARGTTVQGTARFETLVELLTTLSNAGGGLGFRVRQNDQRLLFEIYQPRDLTPGVRFDIDNDTIAALTYSYGAPGATVAVVGGAGEDAARILQSVTTDDSTAAEALWGRRIERFVDQQSELDPDALTQAGVDNLAADGKTVTSLTVDLIDTEDRVFGRDYWLGDKVTVVVDPDAVATDGQVPGVLSAATITFGPAGYQAKALIGDIDAAGGTVLQRLARAQKNQARRVSALERRR